VPQRQVVQQDVRLEGRVAGQLDAAPGAHEVGDQLRRRAFSAADEGRVKHGHVRVELHDLAEAGHAGRAVRVGRRVGQEHEWAGEAGHFQVVVGVVLNISAQ